MSTQHSNHHDWLTTARRAQYYFAMFALIGVIAFMSELLRTGHFDGVADVLLHAWQWLAKYISDVTSAEVGATVIARMFGAPK